MKNKMYLITYCYFNGLCHTDDEHEEKSLKKAKKFVDKIADDPAYTFLGLYKMTRTNYTPTNK